MSQTARYIEVTVPRQLGRIAGIRTYVCSRLEPQDRRVIDGIPCTSTALTLLNLAAVLPRRQLERACDEAEVQRLLHLAAIEDVLERFRGSRGAARLRAVLDEHAIGARRRISWSPATACCVRRTCRSIARRMSLRRWCTPR